MVVPIRLRYRLRLRIIREFGQLTVMIHATCIWCMGTEAVLGVAIATIILTHIPRYVGRGGYNTKPPRNRGLKKGVSPGRRGTGFIRIYFFLVPQPQPGMVMHPLSGLLLLLSDDKKQSCQAG